MPHDRRAPGHRRRARRERLRPIDADDVDGDGASGRRCRTGRANRVRLLNAVTRCEPKREHTDTRDAEESAHDAILSNLTQPTTMRPVILGWSEQKYL